MHGATIKSMYVIHKIKAKLSLFRSRQALRALGGSDFQNI